MKKFLYLILHFLTAIAKVIAVYGLSISLVVLLGVVLWGLGQGRDVMISVLESKTPGSALLFYFSIYFFVFVAWYSARIISFQKKPPGTGLLHYLYTHIPRLIGFFIYAVIIICLYNAYYVVHYAINISGAMFIILVLMFVAWYMLLYMLFDNWCTYYGDQKTYQKVYAAIFYIQLFAVVVFGLLQGVKGIGVGFTILFLLLLQAMYLFLVISRRKVLAVGYSHPQIPRITRLFFKNAIPRNELQLFAVLNLLSLVVLIVYAIILFNIPVAREVGSFAIAIMALALWTGFINLMNMLAFIHKINIGFILIAVLFIGGLVAEPHYIRTQKTDTPQGNNFDDRLRFEEYFEQWYLHHQQEFDSNAVVTLLFTLGDGGASRSGYWVASVLDALQDTLGTAFSDHLFCLSGASGGSVGNVTYYAQLYNDITRQTHNANYTKEGTDFLKTDFLSYPLVRLLGPGIIINAVAPIIPDRAWALEDGIAYGTGAGNRLNGILDMGMSRLAAVNKEAPLLPILCINTTRMQDARPGYISTVVLDSTTFSNRIDVLSLLPGNIDISLATATVLGARFPYFSPAGAIETTKEIRADGEKKSIEYFVDGGYFDNSGAGIVHEMIQRLEQMKVDPLFVSKYNNTLQKMRYCVIHITNSPIEDASFDKIHTFKNDLLAPIVTLAGSYGSQTHVNDLRLENYMNALNKRGATQTNRYYDINLYRQKGEESYPMNWAISKHNIRRMNSALQQHPTLPLLKDHLLNLYGSKR